MALRQGVLSKDFK